MKPEVSLFHYIPDRALFFHSVSPPSPPPGRRSADCPPQPLAIGTGSDSPKLDDSTSDKVRQTYKYIMSVKETVSYFFWGR